MKKTVVAFIAGFLLAIGASGAYAEVESFIGKKVDGQFPLIVNGEQSEVPAITIEGRSYIPLRVAGEIFGAKVAWLDGEVIMEKQQSEDYISPEEYAERARIEQERFDQEAKQRAEESLQKSKLRGEIEGQIMLLQSQIKQKKTEIENREEGLKNMPQYIEVTVDGAVPYEGSELQKKHQEDLAKLKQELADLEAQLAELEQQKAELEQQLETP